MSQINPSISQFSAGISQGSLQEPPKQETLTLQPQERLTYFRNLDFFRIFDISVVGANDLKLRFGDSATETDLVGSGIGYKLPYVTDRIVFFNSSTSTAHTFTFVTAIGDVTDDRVNFTGTLSVNNLSPNTFNSGADVAVLTTATTLILATNANRRQAIITNLDTNAGTVRIGDSGAGASNGVPLAVGSTLILDTSADIYCYNPNALTVNMSVSGLENV